MVVNSYGPSGRTAQRSWASTVAPILTSSGSLAELVHEIYPSGAAHPENLQIALGALQRATVLERDDLAAVRLPAPPKAGLELSQVLAARAQGAADLSTAATLATGAHRDTAAAQAEVVAAGKSFAAADRTYHLARADLAKDLRALFPPASWLSEPALWSGAPAASFVSSLSTSRALTSPNKLKFLTISLVPAPVSYSGEVGINAPPTTTTTTSTTLPAGPSGPFGFVPTTTLPLTTTSTSSTTTTTTLPLPVAYPQILPAGATAILTATPTLVVVVVVENQSDTPQPVTLTATLVTVPRGRAKTVESHAETPPVTAGGSRYLKLPTLQVSGKASAFDLVVRASAPGVAPAGVTLRLNIQH